MPKRTQKKVRRKKKTKTKKKPKVMKGGGGLSRFKRDLNKFYNNFILGNELLVLKANIKDIIDNINKVDAKDYEEFVTTLFQFCNEVRSIHDDNNPKLSIIEKKN